jgi:siroheme synthase-like protein
MKHYFQASLDVEARPCLVVGGGAEAEEKTGRLLEAGGRVTVVSPDATPQLEAWAEQSRIVLHRRRYEPADLEGMYLAVNTVKSDPALSREIFGACEARRILISAYDQPEDSNFVMVALVRSGWLRVAFATGATSPALARTLREEFERVFDGEFAAFTEYLAEMRRGLEAELPKGPRRSAELRRLVEGLRIRAEVEYPEAYRRFREAGAGEEPEPEAVGAEGGIRTAGAPARGRGARRRSGDASGPVPPAGSGRGARPGPGRRR